MRNMCHETKTQFRQQGSSDSCFSVRNFHQHCCARESPAWSPDCGKSAELRMESGCPSPDRWQRSEEHTSELQSRLHLVCRLLLEKKKKKTRHRDSDVTD